MDLVEDAARYSELLGWVGDDELPDEGAAGPQDGGVVGEAAAEDAGDGEAAGDGEEMPTGLMFLDLALCAGFLVKAKADGWKRFCERLSIPPFAVWKLLPGFDRLQRALKLAEVDAFDPEELICWLNKVRPKGRPEVQKCHITPDWHADQLEAAFRERVKWWGGKP
jgi:hypothetical protein